MRIAICDDEIYFIENLEKQLRICLEQYDGGHEFAKYSYGSQLLLAQQENRFDVIFLDIDMPSISGFEVAEKIREEFEQTHIVFVTNKNDLVYNSIRFEPFRFLRKDHLTEELPETIESLLKKMRMNQQYIIKKEDAVIKINASDIVYVESQKHKLTFHLTNDKIVKNDRLKTVEKELLPFGFVRVHSGYLVNCKYIYSIDATTIKLTNSNHIPMSRQRKAEVKNKFQQYMRTI